MCLVCAAADRHQWGQLNVTGKPQLCTRCRDKAIAIRHRPTFPRSRKTAKIWQSTRVCYLYNRRDHKGGGGATKIHASAHLGENGSDVFSRHLRRHVVHHQRGAGRRQGVAVALFFRRRRRGVPEKRKTRRDTRNDQRVDLAQRCIYPFGPAVVDPQKATRTFLIEMWLNCYTQAPNPCMYERRVDVPRLPVQSLNLAEVGRRWVVDAPLARRLDLQRHAAERRLASGRRLKTDEQ